MSREIGRYVARRMTAAAQETSAFEAMQIDSVDGPDYLCLWRGATVRVARSGDALAAGTTIRVARVGDSWADLGLGG
jgi:hypothetical protein